jgi:hypothetical protein
MVYFFLKYMDRLMQAAVYAAHMYRQRALNLNGDPEPFINHALNIVNLLIHRGGVENITWLAASLLSHIEPAQFRNEEVRLTFGREVENLAFRIVVARRCKIYGMLSSDARTLLLAEFAVKATCFKAIRWSHDDLRQHLEEADQDVAQIGNVNDALWMHFQEAVKACKIKLD